MKRSGTVNGQERQSPRSVQAETHQRFGTNSGKRSRLHFKKERSTVYALIFWW
jgi:hypothetical protein